MRNLGLPHPEARHRHLVLDLIRVPVGLARRAAHGKAPAGDCYQVDNNGLADLFRTGGCKVVAADHWVDVYDG
ncbi:MAG: hypothetical protein WCQ50_22685 [Spirochaetota bacterium]